MISKITGVVASVKSITTKNGKVFNCCQISVNDSDCIPVFTAKDVKVGQICVVLFKPYAVDDIITI